MYKTVNGVVYNLEYSDYTVTKGSLVFYFSSKLHKQKFLEQWLISRELFFDRFINKYGVEDENIYTLADILLYEKIETRGFRISDKLGVYTCKKEIIICGGQIKIRKDCPKQSENLTQK